MSDIVNKFLLLGDKFMPESIWDLVLHIVGLHIVLVDHLQKTKKEYENIKKQEIHDIFIKTN